MQLKPYQPDNLTAMLALFHRTVHTVNAKDYTTQQQDAWAPGDVTQDPQRRARWDQTLREHLSLLAWEGEELMGFGDIDLAAGYLDRLYVGADFQGRGVATALCDRLEQAAREAGCERVCSDVSITARPFFESRGYRVLCRQQPELEVRIARQIVRLPLTKIYYATAQNHYVRVVTDDGECRATANFAQVQEQLQTQPEFLVCNRGVIINMSKVLRFEGDCIEMLDGTHLPVRQKDKNSLLAQFTQYQFRGMQREF